MIVPKLFFFIQHLTRNMVEIDRKRVDVAFLVVAVILTAFAILRGQLLLAIVPIVVFRLLLTLERIERNLRAEQ